MVKTKSQKTFGVNFYLGLKPWAWACKYTQAKLFFTGKTFKISFFTEQSRAIASEHGKIYLITVNFCSLCRK